MISTLDIYNQINSLDDILKKISVYDLYKHYIGDFKINRVINSPLREDNNPSFCVFMHKQTNNLLYKDYSTGECGDIIKFVKTLYNLNSYNEVLDHIVNDINLPNIKRRINTFRYTKLNKTEIGIVRQSFTDIDIKYWSNYGITIETLNKFNVFSIKYYLVNSIVKGIYSNYSPMFAYKIFDKFKIYRPLADKFTKWRTNTTIRDVQGFEQLPKSGDLLIITKSLKDIMALHELGYTAVSSASEEVPIPDDIIANLKERFKHIIVIYDRDKSGFKNARKLVKKHKLDFMFINKKYKSKDVSDFINNHGIEIVKTYLNNNAK